MIAPFVPLGDLCDVLDSRRQPVTKRDRAAGDFPYYGATGILDYVSEYIFDEKLVLIGEDGAKWGAVIGKIARRPISLGHRLASAIKHITQIA